MFNFHELQGLLFSPVLHNWTFKSANSHWNDSTLDSKAPISCRFSFASSNISPVSSWEWLMKTQGDQSDEVSLSGHRLQAWCTHKHLRTFGVVSFFTSISSFSSVTLLIFCANFFCFFNLLFNLPKATLMSSAPALFMVAAILGGSLFFNSSPFHPECSLKVDVVLAL